MDAMSWFGVPAFRRAVLLTPVERLLRRLAQWRSRSAQLRQLALIAESPHLLRDLGLSTDQARREAAKRFWRP
jgi:uncharacterized protein YjiS (DUF1127 family)